jgi:hypothetical protein
LDVLKAWAAYYLLKCVVVILAMHIGERLGFLVVSIEKGPGVQEGVGTAWGVLAVYYSVVAVVAALLFRWAVSKLVVSRMAQVAPVRLSLFDYCKAWVVYAAMTFTLGYLITLGLDYAFFHLMMNSSTEASWTGWLRTALRPITFTLVSLLVFRWAVIRLLLAKRSAPASL